MVALNFLLYQLTKLIKHHKTLGNALDYCLAVISTFVSSKLDPNM